MRHTTAAKKQTKDCITITFGECVENHAGNQQIGNTSNAGDGFSVEELLEAKNRFETAGAQCELVDLSAGMQGAPEAALLIVRGGVHVTMKHKQKDATGNNYAHLQQVLKELKWDKKAWMKGGVKNKHARWNLCFANFNQRPDYEQKRGRVVSFASVPLLQTIRGTLPEFLGMKASNLFAEGNYYYDARKCYIKQHGDKERRKVIGLRFGTAQMPLCFQWFQKRKPVSERMEFILEPGDLYIMSEKAVGTDWRCYKNNLFTLRHSAGDHKETHWKKKGQNPQKRLKKSDD